MATAATMSGLQFDALPYEEGRRWELLEGDRLEASSPTPRHQAVVFNILIALRRYLAGGKGSSFADVEFALSGLSRLRPDVCVLLAAKASQLDPDRIPIPGAPDIAIEVISPTERASESHDKVRNLSTQRHLRSVAGLSEVPHDGDSPGRGQHDAGIDAARSQRSAAGI